MKHSEAKYRNNVRRKAGFKTWLAISFTLHMVLYAVVIIMIRGEKKINEDILNDIRQTVDQQQAEATHQAEEAMQETVRETAKDAFRQMLDDVLAGPDEMAASDEIKEMLQKELDQFLEQQDFDSLTEENMAEQFRLAQQQWAEMLAERLEELKQEKMQDLLKQMLAEKAIPDLLHDIQQRFKYNLAGTVERNVSQMMHQGEFQEELRQVNYNERKELMSQLVNESLDDIHQYTAEQIAKTLDENIDYLTEQMLNGNNSGNQNPQFAEYLARHFRDILAEELKKLPLDETMSTLSLRSQMDLLDPDAMRQAREAIQQQVLPMLDYAKQQQTLSAAVSERSKDDMTADQRQLAEQMDTMIQSGSAALDHATALSRSAHGDISRAMQMFQYRGLDKKGWEAITKLKDGKPDESRRLMEEMTRLSSETAESLANAARALQREEDELRKKIAERPGVDVSDHLSEDRQAYYTADIKKRAQQAIDQELTSAIQQGAQGNRIANYFRDSRYLAALQEIAALEGKFFQMQRSMLQAQDGQDAAFATLAALSPLMNSSFEGFDDESRLFLNNQHLRIQMNRQIYEEYTRRYQGSDRPTADEEPATIREGFDSKADHAAVTVPAEIIYIDPERNSKTPADSNPRKVEAPNFEYAAFGAAAMQPAPLTIDGDLSDWGELKHPMQMRFLNSNAEHIINGPLVYMRWSPQGLYFASISQDTGGIQPCPQAVYDGDALEIWIDTLNTRQKLMRETPSSHQFFFTPFGYKGNPASTFAEWGRGARDLRYDVTYPDDKKERGYSAAKMTPDGYTIECFLKRDSLAVPNLAPGKYLAVNFSVNYSGQEQYQWSASKALATWNKPFTWGDVLLLGTDAELTMAPLNAAADADNAVAVGQAVQITVTDKDMDRHPDRIDRITANVTVAGQAESMLMILAETGADTGIFTGSFDTQSVFLPVQQNTLRVQSGDTIKLMYIDAYQSYGERNQLKKTVFAVGWPLMQLAKSND